MCGGQPWDSRWLVMRQRRSQHHVFMYNGKILWCIQYIEDWANGQHFAWSFQTQHFKRKYVFWSLLPMTIGADSSISILVKENGNVILDPPWLWIKLTEKNTEIPNFGLEDNEEMAQAVDKLMWHFGYYIRAKTSCVLLVNWKMIFVIFLWSLLKFTQPWWSNMCFYVEAPESLVLLNIDNKSVMVNLVAWCQIGDRLAITWINTV